jgi:hypothetical protein
MLDNTSIRGNQRARGESMAYISQEKKAKIVAALKALNLPKTWKYTLAIDHHSELVLTIRQAPATVLDDFIGHLNSQGYPRELTHGQTKNRLEEFEAEGHYDVNLHYLNEQFKGKTHTILQRMITAIKTAGEWFDKSDAQSDYFHTAFYITIRFGKWDKPCTFVGKRRTKSEAVREVAETLDVPVIEAKCVDVPASDLRGLPEGATADVIPLFAPKIEGTAISDETRKQIERASTVRTVVEQMKTTSVGASLNDAALTTLAEAVVNGLGG